jgi:hypothetical protein
LAVFDGSIVIIGLPAETTPRHTDITAADVSIG